jgi:unsaturated rhamnogalacturonyl hydrolase
MLTAPRDHAGIMKHRFHLEADMVWIDVAMAVAPYLLYAGQSFDEPRYVDEAVRQAVLMHDDLIDPSCGLLHQCRGFIAPGIYSQDHWSRGNGWGYFALTELVRGLPADSPHRPEVLSRFVALTDAMAPHQSKRGLWRQEIPLDLSYEESSGSGLILYGIGVGLRAGVLDPVRYRPIFDRGIAGLLSVSINDDFSTENSCPGNLCPGEGEDKGTIQSYVTLKLPYRDEPHSFGPLMLAMTEAALVERGDNV